ncbi:uncharacterized protein LOC134021880 isoform X2 [Osmerus eperlanus]|uniref:uncharacterized protein LOC134021880 isoform X2 n=1 Tax=Osmerus eperlanus TaxID=29151 RepID=UPI002E13AC37
MDYTAPYVAGGGAATHHAPQVNGRSRLRAPLSPLTLSHSLPLLSPTLSQPFSPPLGGASPARLMDGQTSSPPPPPPSSSVVAGPSAGPLWRLSERRSRKAGAGNIFMGVNLRQLQRLFRAAGDQDAERRAQLVWGGGDEAELAHALVGLRTRGRRRGLRGEGRNVLGSHWLRAFNHLRIGESSSSRQSRNQDLLEEAGVKPETPSRAPGTLPGPSRGGQGLAGAPETAAPARGGQGLAGAPETAAPARGGQGLAGAPETAAPARGGQGLAGAPETAAPARRGQGLAGAPETAAPARRGQGLAGAPETAAPARGGPGLKKAGECDTERYLHRIIH